MSEEPKDILKKIVYAGAGLLDLSIEKAEECGGQLLKFGETLAKRGEEAVGRMRTANEELKRNREETREEEKETSKMPDVEALTPEERQELLRKLKALEEEA